MLRRRSRMQGSANGGVILLQTYSMILERWEKLE
jgi:hypothetical protein